MGKTLPEGWSVDGSGRSTHDAAGVLEGLQHRTGGGILPLGGLGTALGGHKGYGLAVMVDILCAVLSGAPSRPRCVRYAHFLGPSQSFFRRDPDFFFPRSR